MTAVPVWLHGPLDKVKAEGTLAPLNSIDGHFSFRDRPNYDGDYVLMVVYKGKPTHHLTKKEGSIYTINKKDYGGASTLEQLVSILAKPGVRGWPVPLDKPIPRSPEANDPWLHDAIDNQAANEILAGQPDGTFIVRKRTGNELQFVLSVVYKSRPTHHLVSPDDDGLLIVNQKSYNDATNIIQLVAELSAASLPTGWPVRLEQFVPKAGGTRRDEAASPVSPTTTVSQGDDEEGTPWLHSPMNNTEADSLFSNYEDGTFLIRERGLEFPKQYVISVAYRGKPTHHLASYSDENSCFMVNKKPVEGTATISDVVRALRSKKKFWPVALMTHIPSSSKVNVPQETEQVDNTAEQERERAIEAADKVRADAEAAAAAAAAASVTSAATVIPTRPIQVEPAALPTVNYAGESWLDVTDGGVMGFGDEHQLSSIISKTNITTSNADTERAAVLAEAERQADIENEKLARRLEELEIQKKIISKAKKPRVQKEAKKKMSHQDYLRSIGVLPPKTTAPEKEHVPKPVVPAPVQEAPPETPPAVEPAPVQPTITTSKTSNLDSEEYSYNNKKKWQPPDVKKTESKPKPRIHPAMAPPSAPPELVAKHKVTTAEWTGTSDDDVGLARRRSEMFGGVATPKIEPTWKKEQRLIREAKEAAEKEIREAKEAKQLAEMQERERLELERANMARESNKEMTLQERMASLGIGKKDDGPVLRRRKEDEAEKARLAALEEQKQKDEKERRRLAFIAEKERKMEERRQPEKEHLSMSLSERKKSLQFSDA